MVVTTAWWELEPEEEEETQPFLETPSEVEWLESRNNSSPSSLTSVFGRPNQGKIQPK